MEKVPVTARRARSWSRDEHVGPPLYFDKIPMQHNPFWFAAEVSSETTCPICQARSPLRHRCRIPRKPPRFFLISVARRARERGFEFRILPNPKSGTYDDTISLPPSAAGIAAAWPKELFT
jgi:hypothetical protein